MRHFNAVPIMQLVLFKDVRLNTLKPKTSSAWNPWETSVTSTGHLVRPTILKSARPCEEGMQKKTTNYPTCVVIVV